MPFQAATLIALVAFVLAVAVWWKTRRIGGVIGVAVAAFVVMAITDPSMIEKGAGVVGDFFDWAVDNLFNLGN